VTPSLADDLEELETGKGRPVPNDVKVYVGE
jgi:hypothetical protein